MERLSGNNHGDYTVGIEKNRYGKYIIKYTNCKSNIVVKEMIFTLATSSSVSIRILMSFGVKVSKMVCLAL